MACRLAGDERCEIGAHVRPWTEAELAEVVDRSAHVWDRFNGRDAMLDHWRRMRLVKTVRLCPVVEAGSAGAPATVTPLPRRQRLIEGEE